jgi:hypothetical protein
MTSRPGPGIYDTLLDQTLAGLLSRYPELQTVFPPLHAKAQLAPVPSEPDLAWLKKISENGWELNPRSHGSVTPLCY